MLTKTFSISTYTTFELIRRVACTFWGIPFLDFGLFFIDADGKARDMREENIKVLRFLEDFGSLGVGQNLEENDSPSKSRKK